MAFEQQSEIVAAQFQFLENLAGSVVKDISGESFSGRVPFVPSEHFFIGNILPIKGDNKVSVEFSKFTPTSMGVEFKIKKGEENSELSIGVSCSLYYRVLPTYDEQTSMPMQAAGGKRVETSLKEFFAKEKFQYQAPSLKISNLIALGNAKIPLPGAKNAIDSFRDSIAGRSDIFCLGPRRSRKLPASCLASREAYEKYLRENHTNKCSPQWDFDVFITVNAEGDQYRFRIILENLAREARGDAGLYEKSLYETEISAKLNGAKFSPLTLASMANDYKHKEKLTAIGSNCFAESDDTTIKTIYAPTFSQKELVQRSDATFSMKDLSENPVPVLEKAKTEMEKCVNEFKEPFVNLEAGGLKQKFESDIESAAKELKRFENGMEVIKKYGVCLDAFKLMNLAFLGARKGYKAWKLFQLAFIVSQIPDIAVQEYPEIKNSREVVDLLYFPTGSGKTEAFLGISVMQAFFDRLTGKKFGVSALAKFPLRMLSLQQLQRVADIFASAEKIRSATDVISGPGFESFSVGYYVGKENTPNDLTDAGYYDASGPANLLESWSDEDVQKYLVVRRCPVCDAEKIVIYRDIDKVVLRHKCLNCGKFLDVYITDDAIYRYLPTFVVTTLDKMVVCGIQKKFRNVLGQVRYLCPLHGYTSGDLKDKFCCIVHTCPNNTSPDRESKFIPLQEAHRACPSIIIQDELHLVRDRLGALDSGYETTINNMIYLFNGKKFHVKMLAATATISGYEDQIKSLYLRDARKFPAILEVYLKEDANMLPKRRIYGLMPHGRKKVNAMLSTVEQIFASKQDLGAGPLGSIQESTRSQILQNTRTVLSYYLRKHDADNIYGSISTMVNTTLKDRGYKDIRPESLTGDVDFNAIRKVTDSIDRSESPPDLLIATSLVSHGIDIPKLNIMVFMGIPDSVAEYIQAQSRIGRALPGAVFIVFDPSREWDQSYYKYFRKFHEHYELLIGRSPLNRWSRKGIELLVPGIFSAYTLNLVELQLQKTGSPRMDASVNWRAAYESGKITEDEMQELVGSAIGVDVAPYSWVKDETERSVRKIIRILTDESSNDWIYKLMEPKPLMDLRNISREVTIKPSAETEMILSQNAIRVEKSKEE